MKDLIIIGLAVALVVAVVVVLEFRIELKHSKRNEEQLEEVLAQVNRMFQIIPGDRDTDYNPLVTVNGGEQWCRTDRGPDNKLWIKGAMDVHPERAQSLRLMGHAIGF